MKIQERKEATILWLEDLSKNDIPLVGGKEMLRNNERRRVGEHSRFPSVVHG